MLPVSFPLCCAALSTAPEDVEGGPGCHGEGLGVVWSTTVVKPNPVAAGSPPSPGAVLCCRPRHVGCAVVHTVVLPVTASGGAGGPHLVV